MAFDLNDGDLIFGSGDTRFDSDGYMIHSMGGGMAMDMETRRNTSCSWLGRRR